MCLFCNYKVDNKWLHLKRFGVAHMYFKKRRNISKKDKLHSLSSNFFMVSSISLLIQTLSFFS